MILNWNSKKKSLKFLENFSFYQNFQFSGSTTLYISCHNLAELWPKTKIFSPKYPSMIPLKVPRRHIYGNPSRLGDIGKDIRGVKMTPLGCLRWSKELGISRVNPRTPRGRGGVDATPLAFFPCNFFDDSNRKNRLIVSVTRDGRHILAYVTSSWRCHVTYVMTSYVVKNTLFLPLFVNRDIFWCRCDKTIRLVSFSTKSRSQNSKMLKKITWPWRMILKFKVKLSSTCLFITRLVIMMQSWSWCLF